MASMSQDLAHRSPLDLITRNTLVCLWELCWEVHRLRTSLKKEEFAGTGLEKREKGEVRSVGALCYGKTTLV